MIRVSGESKSRLVKAAGAESCGQRRNQKLHAAVARSTFWSQNGKKLRVSEHFLKFRCRKIARRCGEKHIFKWKCTKHVSFGPLFEVPMSKNYKKNCTPLWREAHFQVKMYKTRQLRTTFWSSDVEKLHAAVARNTSASDHFLKFRCRKIARRCGEKQMFKNWRSRSTFWSSDVEKLHAAVARSTFVSQNVQNTCVLARFLKFRCRKISQVVS